MEGAYPCPLCGEAAHFLASLPARPVHACPRCELRFIPEPWHVSPERERARYQLHRNRLEDEGYVRFLMPVVEALARHLRPRCGDEGVILDYGSGPTPVLIELLTRRGFRAVGYDPYFAPDADLDHPFDAVVSTETFEHFREPRRDIARVAALLRPGAPLIVMTALCTAGRDFPTWPYANDETHVAFYAEETFRFVAAAMGLRVVETNGKHLVVLQKS